MKRIVFATENPGKLREINQFAENFGYEVLSPSQAGFEKVDVEETGTNYEENSRLKVEAYLDQELAKEFVICGDDSGIEINALGGEPGLHSRRWLGHKMSDDEIVGYALGRMHGIADRKAVFKSTVAFSMNGRPVRFVTGEMNGSVANKPFHDAPDQEGFPFRRVFLVEAKPPVPLWKFDELSLEERPGLLSHRESAFKKLFAELEKE